MPHCTPFKECALAVELSGHTNGCLQLPLCIWGMKSNPSEMPDVDYKVSGRRVTGTQAMLDRMPFKERALVVELSGHTYGRHQLPLCTVGLKSNAFTFREVAFRVLGPTVIGTQVMLNRTPFKECAFAVELSGHINRCLQLPLCI